MPVCSTMENNHGSVPNSSNAPNFCEPVDFIKMINNNQRIPENKTLKNRNETTVNVNSDSIVDIRRRRRKYRKSSKSSNINHFKCGDQLAKLSTDDSFDGSSAPRASQLSMNDLLHDLNRIRRISVATGDILGDNRIKKTEAKLNKCEKNRRKSTNSSQFSEAQKNAEMKSIILDPEHSLHSPRQQDYSLPQDIQENVDSLEEWLEEMENTLQPLPLNSRWTKKAINEKMKELKAAHSDIESHGQLIKTTVELCEKYSTRSYRQKSQSLNYAGRQRQSIRHQQRPPEVDSGNPSEQTNDASSDQCQNLSDQKSGLQLQTAKPAQLLSIGRVIERRWHCLWLKSLEWQCFLEQLTWTPRLRKKSLLKPRKSQTPSPEGSTTTSTPTVCNSLGVSSTTITESTQDIRCSSNEDELDELSTSFSYDLNLKGSSSRCEKQQGIEPEIKVRARDRNNARRRNEGKENKHFVREENINLVKQTISINRDLINASNQDKACVDKGIEEGFENEDVEDEGVKMNSSCCSSESSSSLASSMMSSESHHNVNDVMSQSNSSNDIINEEIDEDDDIHKSISKINLNGNLDNVIVASSRDMRLNLANMNGMEGNKEKITTPNNNTSISFEPSSSHLDGGMTTGIVQPTSSAASMSSSGNATCTFSRTFPNCGTYFFRHVSSAEEDDDEDDILDNDTISTSLLSSSSPTPRPADEDAYNSNISPLVTSSPLKSDSGSHLPDFDLDEDDEDLDLACRLDKESLLSAGLNVSDDLNITDGNGRLVPILDFSYMNNGESDLEAIIDSPESSRRKRDIKKLVGDAEKLLFQTVSFTSDESEIELDEEISSSEFEHHNGAASATELTCYQSTSRKNSVACPSTRLTDQKARNCQGRTKDSSGYKRSHSFHNYYGSCSPQSEEEPKKDEPSIVLRRKHSTHKLDGPNLISSGKKGRGSKNASLRNSLNFHNNNSNDNDYGCDASGEVTSTDENDSECQDEEMKSQHNHSAYSLVLVDDIDDFDDDEHSVQSLSPRTKNQKEKSFGSQTIKDEEPQNNSNEADKTITNTNSNLEPTSEDMSPKKADDESVEATPRSIPSSETTNTTPRSCVRRSGPPGCYSFRALPQTPSGTPRGMKAYIRSHTFPKGSKKEDEEELSEYWDQEKYLSEHNYDEQIDIDSTYKLLNFGDDYRNFIDSGPGSDFSDFASRLGSGIPQSGKQKTCKRRMRRSLRSGTVGSGGAEPADSMSETEMDDVWKTVLESRSKLNEVRRRFRNCQRNYIENGSTNGTKNSSRTNSITTNYADSEDGGFDTPEQGIEGNRKDDTFSTDDSENVSDELNSLKDICYENVDCILKLLDENSEKNETTMLKKTERSFRGLLRQWQDMLHLIVKQLQLSENLNKIVGDIKRLEEEVGKVLMGRPPPPVMHNKSDLEKDIEGLKSSIVNLTGLKSDLFNINVEIHNFLADLCVTRRKDSHNSTPQQRIPMLKREAITSTTLRDKVVALYAMWDEAFHRISSQLANSQSTYTKLLQFETESQRLSQIMEQTQLSRRSKRNSASLTDSGISESGDNECEEALLSKLRSLAQDLQQQLTPKSNIIQEITQALKLSETELEESGRLSRLSALSDGEKRSKENSVSDTKRKTVERGQNTDDSLTMDEDDNDQEDVSASIERRKQGYWRRLMCATVPIQAVFLSSLFVSWALDPESGNNCEYNAGNLMNMLYPQLRYVNGPPPI